MQKGFENMTITLLLLLMAVAEVPSLAICTRNSKGKGNPMLNSMCTSGISLIAKPKSSRAGLAAV